MATRTDAEITQSPYFDRWEYSGSTLQRYLKTGPRKAIFKPVLEGHVVKALMEQDEDELFNLSVAFANDTPIYTGAGKTVRATQWWLDWAEGKEDSNAALWKRSAWSFRCVEIRSQSMAQIPWQIVDDKEEEIEDTELETILLEVNPESNWGDLIAGTEADLNIYGAAYWLKIRQGTRVAFLQRLVAKNVEVKVGEKGITGFLYNGTTEYLRENVVYFHTYNPESPYEGLSPLEICRKAIEIESSADSHLASFFGNRAMPAYIFSVETTDINELRRLSAAWKKEYGAGENFKTAFVGGGGTPQEIGYAPDQLALTDVREEARKSICAAYGVPPVLVGAWEAANYATADEQRQSLYTETIIPRAEYIAGVINAELAPDFGDNIFEWEIDQLAVMQEDENDKALRVVSLANSEIISREVAAEEMGYDVTDVPEKQPVPDPLQRYQRELPDMSNDRDMEMNKWRKKAVGRLKQGKSPAVEFESENILPEVSEYILDSLEACESLADINRVFDKAKAWRKYP
jgi:HK97 family phage portal protein